MLIKSMPLVNWSKGLYHVVETQSRCYVEKKTQMDDGTDGQLFVERVGMMIVV